jgi:UDP-N-acetylmuramyl pentapeptide phosphotransferase/UDP-N-acetylglucosamine-1-phosphate transferase
MCVEEKRVFFLKLKCVKWSKAFVCMSILSQYVMCVVRFFIKTTKTANRDNYVTAIPTMESVYVILNKVYIFEKKIRVKNHLMHTHERGGKRVTVTFACVSR